MPMMWGYWFSWGGMFLMLLCMIVFFVALRRLALGASARDQWSWFRARCPRG